MLRYLLYFSVIFVVVSFFLDIFKYDILKNISILFIEYRLLIFGVLGFFLFHIFFEGFKNKEKRSVPKFKLFISIFIFLFVSSALNLWWVEPYFDVKEKFYENLLFFFLVGFVIAIIFQKFLNVFQQKATSKTAIKSSLERSKKSDICI